MTTWVLTEGRISKSRTPRLLFIITPWCRVLLEKLTGLHLVKKFPAFHGTRRFITALTSVRHLSLAWARPIQSVYPHPTSWRSILILSTHLRLGLPCGLLPAGFPTKSLYTPLSSPIRATCPPHLTLLHFITRTILGEQYKSFSSSLCNLLHSPVTSSILGPNILLNTMFSNTLSFLPPAMPTTKFDIVIYCYSKCHSYLPFRSTVRHLNITILFAPYSSSLCGDTLGPALSQTARKGTYRNTGQLMYTHLN